MSTPTRPLATLLNEALMVVYRSLPRYLLHADVWVPHGQRETLSILQQISGEQEQLGQRLAELILDRDQIPDPGEYPVDFARYHFLQLSYMRQPLIDYQRLTLQILTAAQQACQTDAEAADLLAEVMGASRAQLERLEGLPVEPPVKQ